MAVSWRFDVERMGPAAQSYLAKGLIFPTVLKHVDQHTPGGRDAVKMGLGSYAKEIDRIFLAAGDYPVSTLVRLSCVAAGLERREPFAFVRDRAYEVGAEDLRGVMRLLLKVASPESTAERLSKAFNRYFTQCHAEQSSVEKGHMTGALVGIPACIDGFYAAAVEGFTAVALELAGAKGVTATWTPARPDRGESSRVEPLPATPTCRLDFDVRWT